jgi:hypothetical protein
MAKSEVWSVKSDVWGQPSQRCGFGQVREVGLAKSEVWSAKVKGVVGQVRDVFGQVRAVGLAKSEVWSAESEAWSTKSEV